MVATDQTDQAAWSAAEITPTHSLRPCLSKRRKGKPNHVMPDYGSGVRIFCDTLTWRQKTQRHAPKDLAEVRQRVPLPSQRTDSDDDSPNAMPSLDADEKSWETWAFAERRAFRPAERLNAAGQLVRPTIAEWARTGRGALVGEPV
jgi:hypothetical protein